MNIVEQGGRSWVGIEKGPPGPVFATMPDMAPGLPRTRLTWNPRDDLMRLWLINIGPREVSPGPCPAFPLTEWGHNGPVERFPCAAKAS